MKRILLTISYDGTDYCGWQVQPNAVTVQEVLQDAIEKLTGVRSGVIGCSRTDAGVSAEMFCCSFDTDFPLRGEKLCAALNAHLPREIAVYDVREVPADFHPRYNAHGKRYVYRIENHPDGPDHYATLLIHKNEIIGGDITGSGEGGRIHGFQKP